jgi:hypothetical protein
MAKVMRWGIEWEDGRSEEEVREEDRREEILLKLSTRVVQNCLKAGVGIGHFAFVKKTSFWTDETTYWTSANLVPNTEAAHDQLRRIVKEVIVTHRSKLQTFMRLNPPYITIDE